MSTSQASRGSRPSFSFSSSHRRASRAKVGRHAAAVPPSGPRSSCCPILASGAAVRDRPPRAAVHVMAGGMPASASQAPLLRQPRHHPAERTFQRRATCHGATSLAASPAASPGEGPRAWPPSHIRPVCNARPQLASPRVSSSVLVVTAPSPAGLPHCASRERESLPRRAALAKLSPAHSTVDSTTVAVFDH